MVRNIILGHCFLSEDDIKLASLIPNMHDKELDSLESSPPPGQGDFTVKKLDDAFSIFKDEKDHSFRAFLTEVLNLTSERSKQAGLNLTAQAGCIYTLRKPTAWFNQMCGDIEVQEWLQSQIEDGMDVHFVVGLHTLFDATTAEGLALSINHAGNLTAPLGGVPGATVNPLLEGGISAQTQRGQVSVNRCTAPGEQIFALRTKKLKFHFWQTKDVTSVRLAKNSQWTMCSDNRDSNEGFVEIVEASLEDCSDEDEEKEQEFGWYTSDDTEFIMLDSESTTN